MTTREQKSNHHRPTVICERFHKTILQELYQTAFRKKLYQSPEELQEGVDEWIKFYNEEPPHSGLYCHGKTPSETLRESKHLAKAKELDNQKGWLSNQDLSTTQESVGEVTIVR